MGWYEESVVYQIYPLGLTGAPHENDLSSPPVSRLARLVDDGWVRHMRRLGVTCLMLNPVFESLTHGYDTVDYRQVDRRLGTMEDLRRVVEACHAEGIRVLLDGVLTTWGGSSGRSATCGSAGRARPTGTGSRFGGTATRSGTTASPTPRGRACPTS